MKKKFDGKIAKPITYGIYLILIIGIYIKYLAFLLIINLENLFIIFCQPLIQKLLHYYWYDKQFFSFLTCLFNIHQSFSLYHVKQIYIIYENSSC